MVKMITDTEQYWHCAADMLLISVNAEEGVSNLPKSKGLRVGLLSWSWWLITYEGRISADGHPSQCCLGQCA